jgi:hypothetical protein
MMIRVTAMATRLVSQKENVLIRIPLNVMFNIRLRSTSKVTPAMLSVGGSLSRFAAVFRKILSVVPSR